jgi:hypothetical protein
MARPVTYPAHIEPLVQFVEETSPEHIIAETHAKLQAGGAACQGGTTHGG